MESKGYPWPASALTALEMRILFDLKEETGIPITRLLREAVLELNTQDQEYIDRLNNKRKASER
ncbi:hypothetical protein M1N46_01595 [Dehalococcoidia bacterium]|nr:hypothetical protein [Dehalococcoidia bacterium]